jgi:hypothetical protein
VLPTVELDQSSPQRTDLENPMSIDRAIPGSTDPTVAHRQPPFVPTQNQYEPPAGLGHPAGIPGYGPPPGMPPHMPAPTGGGGRRTGMIIAIVAAVIVVLGGIGAGLFVLLGPSYVDPETVSKEIVRITEQNDKVTPTGIQCPDDVPFETGRTFTCTATLMNKPVTYTITQNDDKGAVTINYRRPVLDPASVQKEVVRITVNEVSVEPPGVQCPSDVKFEKGNTFTCSATLQGQPLTYTITQTDGEGGLNIAHDRVLSVKEVSDELAAQLTRDVGEKVVAVCGTDGQTVIVNTPGTAINCGAANAANPDRNAPVTVQIDKDGTLSYQVH